MGVPWPSGRMWCLLRFFHVCWTWSCLNSQSSSHRGRIYHHGRPVDLFFFCKYSSNSLWSFSHNPASFQFCTTHTIVTNKVTLHETSSGLAVKTKLIGKPKLKIVLCRSPEILSLIQAGRQVPKDMSVQEAKRMIESI
jgi:hypothetical protein